MEVKSDNLDLQTHPKNDVKKLIAQFRNLCKHRKY